MSDILKKFVEAGIIIGGLEYVKYRFNSGRPLLEKTRRAYLQIRDLKAQIEGVKPIKLGADDFKVV